MIVMMVLMNFIVKTSNARTEHSNVNRAIVLLHISVVMVIGTVEICQMKLDAHLNILVADTVQKRGSNVITISVCLIPTFVTVLMTVVITVTRHHPFVPH